MAINSLDVKPGGIGLKNVQKRLDLLYPGQHQLNIHDDDNVFTLTLAIKYNKGMINCIIVDDEPLAEQLLTTYIDQLPYLNCAGVCQSAIEAFALLHQQKVDAIFLDIEMPGITGINFLRSLKTAPKVIFTTAYPNYAVDAFEIEAIDYLLKPITFMSAL